MMTDIEHARSEARAQLATIQKLVSRARQAAADNDNDGLESIREEIQERPLSLEVRSGWVVPGSTMEAAEYSILLCTGGPAVRLRGELGRYAEPDSAIMEYQDWGTPWTEYHITGEELDALLEYVRCFYFGD